MTSPTCSGVKPVRKRSRKNLALLRPLTAPRGLTAELVARLTADITSGKLAPGARRPTEQEMIAATGVSRTVVREAVAALRADGLVLTRQGAGAFVADQVRRPFRVDFDQNSSLGEVVNVLELRTGVEVEAAGLAAERGTQAHTKKIGERFEAIQRAIESGETAVDEDFAFRCAIADATGNPQFRRFLEYLGRFIIPRTVRDTAAPNGARARLDLFQREHQSAIEGGAPKDARAAMQRHLGNSIARVREARRRAPQGRLNRRPSRCSTCW